MFSKKYCQQKFYLRPPLNDFVAQLVEQFTLNEWVESSSLSEVTLLKKIWIQLTKNRLRLLN